MVVPILSLEMPNVSNNSAVSTAIYFKCKSAGCDGGIFVFTPVNEQVLDSVFCLSCRDAEWERQGECCVLPEIH